MYCGSSLVVGTHSRNSLLLGGLTHNVTSTGCLRLFIGPKWMTVSNCPICMAKVPVQIEYFLKHESYQLNDNSISLITCVVTYRINIILDIQFSASFPLDKKELTFTYPLYPFLIQTFTDGGGVQSDWVPMLYLNIIGLTPSFCRKNRFVSITFSSRDTRT